MSHWKNILPEERNIHILADYEGRDNPWEYRLLKTYQIFEKFANFRVNN